VNRVPIAFNLRVGLLAFATLLIQTCSTPPRERTVSNGDSTGFIEHPFSPTTTISYDLKDSCRVLVVIYNVQGQIVDTLVNEEQRPGRYDRTWEPSTSLHSGVYFVRLTCAAKSWTTKLVLLR
jgi:hypothetical protein